MTFRARTSLLFLTLVVCAPVLFSCAQKERRTITSLSDLNDSSCVIGYGEDQSAANELPIVLPNATLKSLTDALTAYEMLKQGKIDAFANDRIYMELAIQNGLRGVRLLDENLGEGCEIAVGLSPVSKIPNLEENINAFLTELRTSGELEKIFKCWVFDGDDVMPDIPSAKHPRFHLTVGTTGIVPPYSYYKGTELNGFDIELAKRFALWLGASIEFKVYDYGSIVTAALSGDIDCIFANLNATPERREKLLFSTPIYITYNTLMVRDSEAPSPKKDFAPRLKYNTISEMGKDGVVLGMQTGFVFIDKVAREMLPKAKIEYYNTTPDMAYLVTQGRLDGFINDEPIIRYCALEYPSLGYIHCGIDAMNYVVCFPKTPAGAALRDEMNVFIENMRASGELKRLDDLWLSDDESKKVVDLNIPAKNGRTLKLGTMANSAPFEYIKDGKIVGYEVDLIARFCREHGYGLKIEDVPFDSLILGLESGMYDFAAASLSDTPAHKESLNLSNSIYEAEPVMAVQILNAEKKSSGQSAKTKTIKTLADLNNDKIKIGVPAGSTYGSMVNEKFPKATVQYFNTYIDMARLVADGKLDAMVTDEPIVREICANVAGTDYIHKYIEKANYAFALPKSEKGEKLRKQLNEFLAKAKADGTLQKLENNWIGGEKKVLTDLSALEAKNGTLTLATDSASVPFTFVRDGKTVGYDIDCAALFCAEYGYALKVVTVNFDAIIASIVSEMYDFAASCITVTEERAQSINFSTPDFEGGALALVKADSPAETTSRSDSSFFTSLRASFEKTFAREDRWRLIASGIGTTALISILSAIFGTLLGFGICMLRLSKNRVLDAFALVYIRILQGTPMVVLLMILFYIVFAKTGLDSVLVAVIAFGMNFAAYVSEMMRTGIAAVDKGQTEAALALGYPKTRAFFKIVFPQAARHFLPVYQGEFISLVKMTSVVGYIAIQDLTKASDIIRSRTYEAFFPLVTTAVIYFIIAWLLTRILTALQARLDPKRRRRQETNGGTK